MRTYARVCGWRPLSEQYCKSLTKKLNALSILTVGPAASKEVVPPFCNLLIFFESYFAKIRKQRRTIPGVASLIFCSKKDFLLAILQSAIMNYALNGRCVFEESRVFARKKDSLRTPATVEPLLLCSPQEDHKNAEIYNAWTPETE